MFGRGCKNRTMQTTISVLYVSTVAINCIPIVLGIEYALALLSCGKTNISYLQGFSMAARSVLMFGATGPSGLQTLQQALDRGLKVTAVVRNPDRLSIKHENLDVVIGDATDGSTFNEAMKGKDVVVSCLGAKFQYFGMVDLYSKSITAIHESMRENNVKRGVFMSSWGTMTTPEMSWKTRLFMHVIGALLDDLKRMEDYLESNGTDLDYTVVRPPGLVDGPVTSKKFVVKENGYYILGIASRIMRADVARFLLNCLDTDEYNGKMLALGVEND